MKQVLITGGAGGIGRALAKGYAAKGWEVFVLDKEKTDFSEENIHFFQADLCREEEIFGCIRQIVSDYGALQVLINNGGVSHFQKPITEVSAAEFDRVMDTNLRGTFLCCKAFLEMKCGEGYGRIINIASTRFAQNESNWEAYGASKGGIVSLTNSLCVSLHNTNITVNAISPGWIVTDEAEPLSLTDHRQHPSGRVGKPRDILNVCLFLSEEENDFINGANIVVDGGMTKRMFYYGTPYDQSEEV